MDFVDDTVLKGQIRGGNFGSVIEKASRYMAERPVTLS